jgi:hypothetical protein
LHEHRFDAPQRKHKRLDGILAGGSGDFSSAKTDNLERTPPGIARRRVGFAYGPPDSDEDVPAPAAWTLE